MNVTHTDSKTAPKDPINKSKSSIDRESITTFVAVDKEWLVCHYFLDTLLDELDESKFAIGSVVRTNEIFKDPKYWYSLSVKEREAVGRCVEFLTLYGWFLSKTK